MIRTAIAVFGLQAMSALAADTLPDVTHDGLKRHASDAAAAVYLAEGATLAPYRRILLVDCQVAFQKDWQREHNMNVASDRQVVTANDMVRIREALAAEFRRVFVEELQTNGGYEIVDAPADDVLIVRPAIVNLVVNSPVPNPGMKIRTNYVSAGAMTLYMELYDSATGTILARVVDPEVSKDARFETRNAAVVNKEEADKILGLWARSLREQLDAARR